MKRLVQLIALSCVLAASAPAYALTVPVLYHQTWFTGSTEQLYRIRAALAKVGNYESEAWTFPSSYTWEHTLIAPPWGMGAVDCMQAYYDPNDLNIYNSTAVALGMSVQLADGIVEIPGPGDVLYQEDLPGECYGYLFRQYCAGFEAELICPDPPPADIDAGMDGGS